MRLLTWLLLRLEVTGLEHLPRTGAAIIVSNHLGDADVPVGLAVTPRMAEVLAKAELYDFPVLGWLMDLFGVIWLHRGQPDRRAIRAALQALEQGRLIALAPEGRESMTGALEEGTQGAAFLALRAGVPIVPVTLTGTENSRVFSFFKRLRRAPVTLTVGEPFLLEELPDRQAAYAQGTERIMLALAQQLPPEYQGIYRTRVGMTTEEKADGS